MKLNKFWIGSAAGFALGLLCCWVTVFVTGMNSTVVIYNSTSAQLEEVRVGLDDEVVWNGLIEVGEHIDVHLGSSRSGTLWIENIVKSDVDRRELAYVAPMIGYDFYVSLNSEHGVTLQTCPKGSRG